MAAAEQSQLILDALQARENYFTWYLCDISGLIVMHAVAPYGYEVRYRESRAHPGKIAWSLIPKK